MLKTINENAKIRLNIQYNIILTLQKNQIRLWMCKNYQLNTGKKIKQSLKNTIKT